MATALLRPIRRLVHRRAFQKEFLPSLPEPFRPAALLVFTGEKEPEERSLAEEIEGFRRGDPRLAEKSELVSLPSPRSGTFAVDTSGRAAAPKSAEAPVEAQMRIGVDPSGGLLLRRLVRGARARRVLELGTNTGLSGRYILSAPECEWLDTVEGSADLCRIAEVNLGRASGNFRVMNTLFDEALEELANDPEAQPYDAAFLDGQHEREATLHYVERMFPLLRPGGMVILDDIYWSEGMNEAWEKVRADPRFPLTIDFGSKGVAVAEAGTDGPAGHFDLCRYIGRPRFYRRGW